MYYKYTIKTKDRRTVMNHNYGLDVISCVMDNTTLVQKSHIENFNAKSQLIVNESQEALFYKDGQALDLFIAGRHPLSSDNLPMFKRFFNKLFGAKTPFPCQVYFINKVSVLDILWGLPAPIVLEDPQYHLIVNVRASGQTGLRVVDSRRFVVKVVGQLPEFSVETVRRTIKGMMVTSLTSIIANTIVTERVGILEIATRLEALSALMQVKLNEKLADIGLEVTHFNVGTIFADDADLAKLKQAKQKRMEVMNDTDLEAYKIDVLSRARANARAAEGYTYQDERRFDVLQTAASNTGAAGGMINAGVGLGMGLGVMGEVSRTANDAIREAASPAPTPAAPAARACAKCGASVSATAKFCPECGEPQAPAKKFCPECGVQADGNSRFCSSCGHKF